MYTNREYHYTLCLYSSLATVSQCLNPNWITAGNLSFAVRQHRKRARRYFQGVHWFVPTEFQQEELLTATEKGLTGDIQGRDCRVQSPQHTHTKSCRDQGHPCPPPDKAWANHSQRSLPKEISETELENKPVLPPSPGIRPFSPDHHPSSSSTYSLLYYFSHNHIGNFHSKPWKHLRCLCGYMCNSCMHSPVPKTQSMPRRD